MCVVGSRFLDHVQCMSMDTTMMNTTSTVVSVAVSRSVIGQATQLKPVTVPACTV